MTTLRLLVDLLCIIPRIVWAWVKLQWRKLWLRRYDPCLRCRDCGWKMSWDTASLICNGCQIARRKKAQRQAPVAKLFCCDVDLEYQRVRYERTEPEGTDTTIKAYSCPACDRTWLYVETWYPARAREVDWHPQRTVAEVYADEIPPLFDDRTRTKIYPQPFRLD